MRWTSGRRSSNVEDRRGGRVSRKVAGGGIGTLILVLVALYFGMDPSELLQQTGTLSSTSSQNAPYEQTAQEQELVEFVSVVLADTEDTWNAIFAKSGHQYIEPKLVLFSGAVQSACGYAQSATGPFYCPADQKVHLDLDFFQDRPTALPGCGPTTPIGRGKSSRKGISKRRSTPPMPSAMTVSRCRAGGMWCPTLLPTALRPSASNGSSADSPPAAMAPATPSIPTIYSLHRLAGEPVFRIRKTT